MVADCIDCGQVVDLDRYMNCVNQRPNVRHAISNLRSRPPRVRPVFLPRR
jgi:hypothetical protein